MLGSLIGRRREIGIAKTAAAAFQPDDLLPVFQYFDFLFARLLVPCDCPERNLDNNILPEPPRTVIAAAGLAILRQHILIIPQMQERPQMFAAPKDDMRAPAAVTAVRPSHRIELRPHK